MSCAPRLGSLGIHEPIALRIDNELWANTNFGVAISADLERQLSNRLWLRTELVHCGGDSRDIDVAGMVISNETRGLAGRAALVYASR